MSKKKFALVVTALAFGVNIFAFFISKKAFLVEEVKNVWLYELPLTASPLDSYVAIEFGPQNGVIGTLYHLMETYDWKPAAKKGLASKLSVKLKPGLTFSSHEPIVRENWMTSADWARPYLERWSGDPLWKTYLSAQVEWVSDTEVKFSWNALPASFSADEFLKKILSHPMTGVYHPQNLSWMKTPAPEFELQRKEWKEMLGKKWISSGSYRVRKWNPKEIMLINRDDFPVTMAAGFFRTLKFQSAPVKNPSSDFMQAMPGEEKGLDDHRVNPVDQVLHVFWICRSWKQAGTFCADSKNRENFAKMMTGSETRSSLTLASQHIRYRIPFGSDAFRKEVTERIKKDGEMMGAKVSEVSYFFKPSTDADIELLFVVTDSRIDSKTAAQMALYSSRLEAGLGDDASNLVGEVAHYPIQVLMKNMKGDAFSKVFLEADLDEKKIPL